MTLRVFSSTPVCRTSTMPCMKKLVMLAAVAGLALPAAAEAHKPAGQGKAAKACKAEQAADPAAFKAKYANKNGEKARKRCVRAHLKQARAKCKSERSADAAAFKAKYANKKGKKAYKRCVRAHAGDAVA